MSCADICIAIIPARAGSKGVKNKNIVELNGKPLISYTIEAALDSGVFDHVFVTTDGEEIAEVSAECGAEVIDRPRELALDKSSSIDVIVHALEAKEFFKGCFCLLQPTSPLRDSKDIREAFELYKSSEATSVISATSVGHHPYKCLMQNKDGNYAPIRNPEDLVSARQDLPICIAPNGAIYFCDIASFLEQKVLFFPNTEYFLMRPDRSVDVDSLTDLKIAEFYLSNQ
ncbi:acylneuraminate cytidylyltransferase family protein [Marinifilum sp. JC120]|nr:acylneuraminate cytidylyltransferase family protein [Marinifilum sp. JC120]